MAEESSGTLAELALDGLLRVAVRVIFWTVTAFAGLLYGWGCLVTAVRAMLQGSGKR
jgi:hypothetical protein